MAPRLKLLIAAGALAFVVAHVHALPESLGDFDSINFALGVEAFDVARHQPHPPGYPVFIALARVSTAVVRTVRPDWDRDHVAAAGLALLSAAAGTAAMLFLVLFWRTAGFTEAQASAAALVAAVSPLYWLTASRPLSDMVGPSGQAGPPRRAGGSSASLLGGTQAQGLTRGSATRARTP